MASWFESLSIRTRIILLMLAILLPITSILSWLLASELKRTREAAYVDVQILVTSTAASLQRKLAQSETILTRLAARPAVQALDPKNCDPIIAEFVPLNPEYLTLDVRDVHGNMVCSYLSSPNVSPNASEALWFASAMRSGGFTASSVAVGRRTGRKLTALSYPIRARDGASIGLVTLAVDLLTLNQQLLASTPKNAVVAVIDPTQAIVLRSTDPATYIGTRPLPGTPDPIGGAREGFRSATGRDGVVRLFALRTLPGVNWRVVAGISKNEAFAAYDDTVAKTAGIGLAVLILGTVGVWRLSAAIVDPISKLRRAAARVAAGEGAVRAEVLGAPELSAVAKEFNRMLDARALSEARLRGIFESATDAILTADDEQVIVQANSAAAEVFRCTIDDLIGSPIERFVPAHLRQQHRQDMKDFGASTDVSRLMGRSRVVTALRADGQEFPIDASVSHLTTAGQLLYTVILRDVTERDQAHQALQASSANLQAALSSMSEAVCISDAQCRLVEFNESFATFLRFKSRADCPAAIADYVALFDVLMDNGEPAPLDQWAAPRALRGETATGVEYRMRRRDTSQTWIGNFSYAPIRSEDGTIIGSVVSARDVTAQRRAQRELESAHEELQRLIAAKDRVQEDERRRIARDLHDDLQQTLTAIRIDVGMMNHQLTVDPTKVAPMLAKIDKLASSAIVSTRRIVNHLQPQALNDLGLVPALEMLSSQFTELTGIACHVDALDTAGDASIPSTSLTTSLYRITQEALNNVMKHARATEVNIRLASSGRHHLVLRVADNGIGMSVADRKKAQSFGLMGMQERVRALGGELRIESRMGAGTAIEVVVPVPEATSVSASAPREAQSAAAAPLLGQDVVESSEPDRVETDLRGRDGAPALATMQRDIDALPGNIAVLDAQGVIRIVNRAWRHFAQANGDPRMIATGPDVNYLEVCRQCADDDEIAGAVLKGLREVIDGSRDCFMAAYPCHSPHEQRWFVIEARPMPGGYVKVAHLDITQLANPVRASDRLGGSS